MPLYTEQFIQQVQQATDIVDLVSQYVSLKQKGREYVGLCPFHDDRNPSMYVNPVKQLFKCFVCGAGGGVYQWLMKYDKLSFPEAVEQLAERANIPLPTDTQTPRQRGPAGTGKRDLLSVIRFAADFFGRQLDLPAGRAAREYVLGRGLDEEALKRFGVGFAPNRWDGLLSAARKKGISPAQLESAGLVMTSDSGRTYDRFRNRLILPISDPTGRTIAFGGRAMDPEDRAKYLNSPETSLFDKSSNLYALDWARQGIVSTGRAVVVEGYFDALIPLHLGAGNVVATLGTALTERHVRLLSRYADEVVLVFDADQAGAAAARRALEAFLNQQFHVRVATIPEGKDPCDYCLSAGVDAFGELIDAAPDALEYVWQQCQAQAASAGDDLAGRRSSVEDFLKLVASSEAYGAIDEIRRSQIAQRIGHLLNVSPRDLQQQMRRLARRTRRAVPAAKGTDRPRGDSTPGRLAERQVLEVLLSQPDLFDEAFEQVVPEDFTHPQLRRIAEGVWQKGEAGRLTVDELLCMESLSDLGGRIAELAAIGEDRGNYQATLSGAIAHIIYQRQRRELADRRPGEVSGDTLRDLTDRLRQADPRRIPRIR
jgi:DNA primase